MTKQERAILEILMENPMLSQTELAEMLNLTRSSVSVYISHLMRDGYIRGRGYVLHDQKSVCIIGTSCIDYRTVMNQDHLIDSGTTTTQDDYELAITYGGIAKNIAENMVRFDHTIFCISAIGSDKLGDELIAEYKQNGINVDDVLIVPASRSSTHLEIDNLDFSKILFSSANTKLQKRITPSFLASKQNKLRHASIIITEDSMSTETLQYLSSNYSPTFLVCSKPSRVQRYSSFLNQFNGLVASLDIACQILDEPLPASVDDPFVFSITARLHSIINGPVLLCYETNKFSYTGQKNIIICEYSDPLKNAALYPHYRDTIAAGLFHCLMCSVEDEELLKFVSACRDIVSQSTALVNQKLCHELISSVIIDKRFQFSYGRKL